MSVSIDRSGQVLYVPTVPRNFSHSHISQIIADLADLENISDEKLDLKIDFQACEFLNHAGVAFLGGLVRLIESRGGRVTFAWDTLRSKIEVNLAQNGFLQEFGHHRLSWMGNSIPFWSHCQRNLEFVASYLSEKWLGRGWISVSSKLRNAIVGQVSEVYLNAFEHSRSPVGVFSCGQHYPNAQWLHLTAIDFGVGIPNTVRSLPQNLTLSTEEALRWALMEGTSTKAGDGISRGMGLNLLQEFVRVNQGILKIFSHDGYVVIDRDGIQFGYISTKLSGTLVDIALQCDESYYCLDSESPPKQSWF